MRTPTCAGLVFLSLSISACDGSPPDPRREGPADEVAMHACEAVGETPIALVASGDATGAASAVVALGHDPYRVTLPEGARGYAVLRTLDEHSDIAIFVREHGALIAMSGPGLESSYRPSVCPSELADEHRSHVHDPDDYLLTFSESGPREIWFAALLEGAGHPGDDAGVHDHDAGDHHHDGGH